MSVEYDTFSYSLEEGNKQLKFYVIPNYLLLYLRFLDNGNSLGSLPLECVIPLPGQHP